MEIFEYDGFSDVVKPNIDDIKSSGFSVRSGNKVLTFILSEETSLPEDDLKEEYNKKIKDAYTELKHASEIYKDNLKSAYDIKVNELNELINEAKEKSDAVSILPDITPTHTSQGLYVASDNNNIKWYLNCVYHPKFVNNRSIESSFAKRLMTPITIEITTRKRCITSIRVLKIIGHEKFQHYHSLSENSDCWGDFKYSGDTINNADEALVYARKVLLLLDTINEFSLGKRNPKGLSRFNTISKHLLDDDDISDDDKKTSVNSRNIRSGFDTNVNDEISSEMVWSTS